MSSRMRAGLSGEALLCVVLGMTSQDLPPGPAPRTACVALSAGGHALAAYPLAHDPRGAPVLLTEDGSLREVPDLAAATTVLEDVSVDTLPADGLLMGLGHADPWVRADCQRLLTLRTTLPVDLVSRVLRGGRPAVRTALLLVLQRRPLSALSEDVRSCLFHDDETVRATALAAYGALRPRDLLARCESTLFRDPAPRVRHEAVVQMAASGDLEAVDLLLEHVVDEDDRNVEVRIFDALRRLTGKSLGRCAEDWISWWHNHREELVAQREAAADRSP